MLKYTAEMIFGHHIGLRKSEYNGVTKSERKALIMYKNWDRRALTTIFGNGTKAPGIGKISSVSVKIGKIVYRQTSSLGHKSE